MAHHSSATRREETPHLHNTLNRRAQALVKDKSVDAQARAIIRYGLETNDPSLAELVRRLDAGEPIVDVPDVLHSIDDVSERIETLAEMICRAGDEPVTKSAALFVLMATLENSNHPKALANSAKHLAFTHCGELNLYGMVDAQVATRGRIQTNRTRGSSTTKRCNV